MKALVLALAAMLMAGQAQAVIRTLDVQVTNLVETGDFFGILGVTGPDPTSITARISFDTEATPYFRFSNRQSIGDRDLAAFPYLSFVVTIGDVVVSAAPSVGQLDRILVADGVRDGTQNIPDTVEFHSRTVQPIGVGVALNEVFIGALGNDETTFTGTDIVDVATLNMLDTRESFLMRISNATGFADLRSESADSLTFYEQTAVVPLPPSLPLLLAGLSGLAWLRRR